MADDLEFSRQKATVASLAGDTGVDVEHFFDKPVLLTGDPEYLKTENGRWALLDSARLLIRMTKRLTIALPYEDGLAGEVSVLARTLTKHQAIVVTDPIQYDQFKAILSVGASAKSVLPWTAINSNGWSARVSSGGTELPTDSSQPNPIGALTAACFGVSEIFKRLIRLKPERGAMLDGFSYSLYSYAENSDPGPAIKNNTIPHLMLLGGGAIGNGVCQLLLRLPLSGRLSIVDNQRFSDENLGTCLLLTTDDLGEEKATALAARFTGELVAKGYSEDISSFMRNRLGKELDYPAIILSAVDNIDARHQVQTIWPDLIIDGAIGTLACEATLHPWGDNLSCLICDFAKPAASATAIQSQITGLCETRLTNLMDFITDDDVRNAPPEKRELLKSYVGKQICSLLSGAEVEAISQETDKSNFQPSVPFVACLSACMMVTELVRRLEGSPAELETGYQFDALVGPQNGIRKAHFRKPDCVCVERRSLIEQMRARRSSSP
jgi:hypothetical protein